jgi:hypothetical protein
MQDILNQFVDKLVEEKRLLGLDPEVLKQVKADLGDRLENRVNAALLDNMPPEKVQEFEKMIDSDASDKEVQEFCRSNIPDLDSVVAGALMEFKRVYLNL